LARRRLASAAGSAEGLPVLLVPTKFPLMAVRQSRIQK
jgi:hypothetical protein